MTPLPEPTRVRDTRTGNEYTTRYVKPDVHEVLDEPAVDRRGRFLDIKPAVAAPTEELNDPGYDAMRVDELRDAIKARNEGRDDADLIPLAGNKPDLVAALHADDTRTAENTTRTNEGTPS